MRILFLPNWEVKKINRDDLAIQAPDKNIFEKPYWFFKYIPNKKVDIIDYQAKNLFHHIEKKFLKNYIVQSLKAFLKRKNYDVIISHGAQSGLFYSLLSCFFRQRNSPKHIIIDIGGMNGSRINKYETPLIKIALKSKPSIIYHAKPQYELYQKYYPELLPNSKFIHFGVDSEYFVPLNLPSENYVLSFGYSKRDYPTLIKAWKLIEFDTKLMIVGIQGESNDRIIYTEKQNIHQLKELIAKSLFVIIPLPVFNYSYGQMSFLQSMAMGKTVIVTRTPSSDGYLVDGQGTFYVNPYDAQDMANKINFLLANRESLTDLGKMARKQIEERLNEKIMAERIYEFIKDQLNENPSRQ